MGVPIIHQPYCKVCNRLKGDINGWFLVRISDREFTFRDYNQHMLRDYDFAVCGAEHLDKVQREHVESLLGIRSGGAANTAPLRAHAAGAELSFSK